MLRLASSCPAACRLEAWVLLPISRDDHGQITSLLHALLSPPVKWGQRFHNRRELRWHPPPTIATHKHVRDGVLQRVWLSPLLAGLHHHGCVFSGLLKAGSPCLLLLPVLSQAKAARHGTARHGGRCRVGRTSRDTRAGRRLEPGRCVAVTQ